MKQAKRISRDGLVATVGESLDPKYHDDLPAIRTALNDTADGFRKDGWSVGDFNQERMVKTVQTILRARL